MTVAKNVDSSVLKLADSNVMKPRADAEDAALSTRLWAESEKIVQAL